MLQDGSWQTSGCLLGERRLLGEMMAAVKGLGKGLKSRHRMVASGCEMEVTGKPTSSHF